MGSLFENDYEPKVVCSLTDSDSDLNNRGK